MQPSLIFTMKQNHFIFVSALLLLLVFISSGCTFLSRENTPPTQAPAIPQEAEILQEAEYFEDVFPEDQEPVEISLQRAVSGKTVAVSWDDSQMRTFNIIVFDAELFKTRSGNPVVWSIISLRQDSLTAEDSIVQTEDFIGFIPSGYRIGETISEYKSSPSTPDRVQLSVGKEYIMMVNGLTDKELLITINKEFTFTESCLPPNCR